MNAEIRRLLIPNLYDLASDLEMADGPQFAQKLTDLTKQLEALLPPPGQEESCPHCRLPRELPAVCTPELNEILNDKIARDSKLVEAGYFIAKAGQEEPPAPPVLALKRYDLVTNYRAGSSIEEMEPADDGEWVRYEDIEAALKAAPPVMHDEDDLARVDQSSRSMRRELPRKPQPEGSQQ